MYKKLFLIILTAVFAFPLYAQKGRAVSKIGTALTRQGTRQIERNAGRQISRRVASSSAAASAARHMHSTPLSTTSVKAKNTSANLVKSATGSAAPVFAPQEANIPGIDTQAPDLTEIESLVQAHGELASEQNLLNTVGWGGGFGKSVLFAPVETAGKEGGFSVTAVEIDGEIFGVIASHVLAESYYTYSVSLHKNFHIQMPLADGSTARVEAQVVQVSPRSMLDISLVKFSPQAEPFLSPLSLSKEGAQPDELLFSYGFANGEGQQIERIVKQNSFISVRTDQNLTGKRSGFCGSPLLDAQGQIKAIHTGTVENRSGTDAVSYGTHARFISLLVEAYHNDGQALYDLEIEGHTLTRLNVDEYISAVYLYDASGKRILQRNWEEKFSQSALVRMLEENPQAAYLQFTSRKAHWETDNDGDSILKEDRSKNDKTKRQHWYNLQTQEILPARPGIIKM